MIKRFGLKAIGVDPTKKHLESLTSLSEKMNGRFEHRAIAISAINGKIAFNESKENVSGSIIDAHKNVANDTIKKYEVESVNLKTLPPYLNLTRIEYIKLDLEGAEYDLIDQLKLGDLEKYEQIFIEFHHHCVPIYTKKDTSKAVNKIVTFGFKEFSVDGKNYLFYK